MHSVASPDPISVRVERQDLSLFDAIPAQLEPDDCRSLLALHAACAKVHGEFTYLEIGSHLGGSLQALVRDPACTSIISIDSRPQWQPDQRGFEFAFPANSTARMLRLLAEVAEHTVTKIQTIDSSTMALDAHTLPFSPQICFIDGEHTDEAALRDARFCLDAIGDSGCIVFHDAAIVYRAIAEFLEELAAAGVPHRAYLLPSTVLAVEIGEHSLRDVEVVRSMILDNYRGYLFSLQVNDLYRTFYNRKWFRAGRRLHARLRPNGVWR